MPPKKNIKMDLSSFLADETFGSATDSWADDFDPSMIQNTNSTVDIGFDIPVNEPAIPENGPFTARISSFSADTTEEELRDFFIKGLYLSNPDTVIEDFYCPKDPDGNLKNFAFITFITKELLIDALALNDKPIHNKPVYVSVAKPSKNARQPRGSRFGGGRFEDDSMDWNGARGARTPRERREEVQIDWDSARGGKMPPPRGPREFRESRGPRPPRDDNFDWGARGSKTQPETPEFRALREPREPREPRAPKEDSFDWGGARGSLTQPEVPERQSRGPPREKREPKDDSFDWNVARGSLVQPEVKKTYKPKTDDFEWGARGSMLKKPTTISTTKVEKKETSKHDGPKKSVFSVLQTEDDDEDEDEEKSTTATSTKLDDNIVKATSNLSLGDEDGWTQV